jgi:DNA-binding MarR family transcriptional regulator
MENTLISNEILQSRILEPEEKSILVHLLSLPIDYNILKTEIWKDMNIGRDRFDKHWKGLVQKGYIEAIKSNDNLNKIKWLVKKLV